MICLVLWIRFFRFDLADRKDIFRDRNCFIWIPRWS